MHFTNLLIFLLISTWFTQLKLTLSSSNLKDHFVQQLISKVTVDVEEILVINEKSGWLQRILGVVGHRECTSTLQIITWGKKEGYINSNFPRRFPTTSSRLYLYIFRHHRYLLNDKQYPKSFRPWKDVVIHISSSSKIRSPDQLRYDKFGVNLIPWKAYFIYQDNLWKLMVLETAVKDAVYFLVRKKNFQSDLSIQNLKWANAHQNPESLPPVSRTPNMNYHGFPFPAERMGFLDYNKKLRYLHFHQLCPQPNLVRPWTVRSDVLFACEFSHRLNVTAYRVSENKDFKYHSFRDRRLDKKAYDFPPSEMFDAHQTLRTGFIVPVVQPLLRFGTLVSPLSPTVWLHIVSSTGALSVFLYTAGKFASNLDGSIRTRNPVEIVLRPLLDQHCFTKSGGLHHRVVLASWFLCALVVNGLYRGTLTGHILSPTYSKEPINFRELGLSGKPVFAPGIYNWTKGIMYTEKTSLGGCRFRVHSNPLFTLRIERKVHHCEIRGAYGNLIKALGNCDMKRFVVGTNAMFERLIHTDEVYIGYGPELCSMGDAAALLTPQKDTKSYICGKEGIEQKTFTQVAKDLFMPGILKILSRLRNGGFLDLFGKMNDVVYFYDFKRKIVHGSKTLRPFMERLRYGDSAAALKRKRMEAKALRLRNILTITLLCGIIMLVAFVVFLCEVGLSTCLCRG